MARPAHPGDELADPARGIQLACGRLRREALVVVVVAHDHDLRARIVERLPDRL